jgi:hypothetical protein
MVIVKSLETDQEQFEGLFWLEEFGQGSKIVDPHGATQMVEAIKEIGADLRCERSKYLDDSHRKAELFFESRQAYALKLLFVIDEIDGHFGASHAEVLFVHPGGIHKLQ